MTVTQWIVHIVFGMVLIYVIWWCINIARWVYNNIGHSVLVCVLVAAAPTGVVIWCLLFLRELIL